jgi:hypothetical protein
MKGDFMKKTLAKNFITVMVATVVMTSSVHSVTESNLPTGRFELDRGTHHEGKIFVSYPWFSQYRTFVLREAGKMPQKKCQESPPGAVFITPMRFRLRQEWD